MKLEGNKQDSSYYSILIDKAGLQVTELDKKGFNSKSIPYNVIKEIIFYELNGDYGNLQIQLKNSDIITINEIKDDKLVKEFFDIIDRLLSDKKVTELDINEVTSKFIPNDEIEEIVFKKGVFKGKFEIKLSNSGEVVTLDGINNSSGSEFLKSVDKKAPKTIRRSKKEIRARKLKQKVQNKNNKNIGPECGTDNPVNAEFCQEGGFKLEKSAKKTFFKSLDYKALLIGTLISIILFYALPGQFYLILLGALASGFIAGGSFKRGAVHGAIPLVTLFIPMAVMMSIVYGEYIIFSIGLAIIICLIYSVSGAFLGVIGAGISKKIIKNQNESIRDNSEVNPTEETKTDNGWWERKTSNEKWKIGFISVIVIICSIYIVAGNYMDSNISQSSSDDIVDSNTAETKTSTPSTTPSQSFAGQDDEAINLVQNYENSHGFTVAYNVIAQLNMLDAGSYNTHQSLWSAEQTDGANYKVTMMITPDEWRGSGGGTARWKVNVETGAIAALDENAKAFMQGLSY